MTTLGAVLFGVFLRVYRPWHSRWGTTDEEVALAMPGDEAIERPTFNVTRAITIRARPEQIWPWIAQIGFGRAGFYSYDLLDNLGRPSAERIVPEQSRERAAATTGEVALAPLNTHKGEGQ